MNQSAPTVTGCVLNEASAPTIAPAWDVHSSVPASERSATSHIDVRGRLNTPWRFDSIIIHPALSHPRDPPIPSRSHHRHSCTLTSTTNHPDSSPLWLLDNTAKLWHTLREILSENGLNDSTGGAAKTWSRSFGTSKDLSSISPWIKHYLIDTARYYQFTKKNPVATLEGISINVLYAFFDWLLRERKDSLGAASSLQTYWNALCLVRPH